MSKKKIKEEPLPVVEVEKEVKETLKNTESVVGGIYSDLDEVGNMVENMQATGEDTAKAIKALVKQYIKDRKQQEEFNRKIESLISSEVEKQLKPLIDRIDNLVASKPKFIFVLPKFPTLDFWSRIKGRFVKNVKSN